MVKIFGSGSYGKLRAWVTSTLAAHTVIPDAHHSKYTDAEVDTIVAAHTAIVDAHHAKYTDGEVDAIVATHTAIASAHHSKYTDAEVDTIVAAHTAIASAHHAKYLDAEAVSAMGAKGDANPLHHDKYTDSEVDAILSVHTAIASAHHAKYLDAEAVSAVASADDYVKNTGDIMSGVLEVDNGTDEHTFIFHGFANEMRMRNGGSYAGNYWKTYGGGTLAWLGAYDVAGDVVLQYQLHDCPGGRTDYDLTCTGLKLHDKMIIDPKNHAASALSGTKKLVEIDIGGVPYYYEVYPTKA